MHLSDLDLQQFIHYERNKVNITKHNMANFYDPLTKSMSSQSRFSFKCLETYQSREERDTKNYERTSLTKVMA